LFRIVVIWFEISRVECDSHGSFINNLKAPRERGRVTQQDYTEHFCAENQTGEKFYALVEQMNYGKIRHRGEAIGFFRRLCDFALNAVEHGAMKDVCDG